MRALPPLPPHCHHPEYVAGCETCRVYGKARNARRARAIAYGRWDPPHAIDSAEAAAHIRSLQAAGMSLAEMARQVDVPHASLRRALAGRKIMLDTAARVLRAVNRDVADPTGVARRLQALTCVGYSLPTLSRLSGQVCRQILGDWRVPRVLFVTHPQHRHIVELYERLWMEDGLSPEARGFARRQGWHPPEAWTDKTIDDPEARPYSDLAVQHYVDEVKLERARLPKGHSDRVAFVDLSFAEQVVLFREHMAKVTGSTSGRAFLERYRPVPAETLRKIRQEVARDGAEAP